MLKTKMIRVLVDTEDQARFQAAADARKLSLSTWMREAARKYAQTNETFNKKHARDREWPSGWPKSEPCFYCEGNHDPLEAHPGLMKADVKHALRALRGETA